MTVRIGVVGAGGMGDCHARNVSEMAQAEVAWIADPDSQRGQALAAEVSAVWLADGLDGFDRCDAVVVACPDQFHRRFVEAALESGRPVLCEKPVSVTMDDAVALADLEVAGGRRLVQMGFMRVFDPAHQQVAEACSGLGSINRLRAVHRNRNTEARSIHELLVQSVIHDFHTVRWLTGSEVVSVDTQVVRRRGRPVHLVVVARLASGALAVIEFDDAAAGYEVAVEVVADDGQVNSAEPRRALVRSQGQLASAIGADWFAPFQDAYRLEMADFVASVAAGEARGPSLWDGLAAQVLVEAAHESAQRGGPVAVPMLDQPDLYAEGGAVQP